jgi:hypothetical protein
LAAVFELSRRFVRSRQAELTESRALYPELQDFESWAARNQARFAAVLAA